jgi:hypothetical protein
MALTPDQRYLFSRAVEQRLRKAVVIGIAG